MAKEENQDSTQKRVGRFQIQAYCTQEQSELFKNHELFAGCSVGQERSNIILQALDFFLKWKDRVEEIESGNIENAHLTDLKEQLEATKQQLEDKEQQLQSVQDNYQSAADEINRLKATIEQLSSENSDKADIAAKQAELKQELEACKQQLATMDEHVLGWDDVSSLIDPAYKLVIEEITKRLANKFNIPGLDPMIVLVTFFMKYYYNQEVEMPGMPFVIRSREVYDIVLKVYPDITPQTLKKALKV